MTEITFTQLVRDIISEIVAAKQGVKHPEMAHITEIRNSLNVELMELLREMYRKGEVNCQLDINKQPLFTLKENE